MAVGAISMLMLDENGKEAMEKRDGRGRRRSALDIVRVVTEVLLVVKRKEREVGVFGVGLGDGCQWKSFTMSGVETA